MEAERKPAQTPEEWFESHSRSVKNAKISHALITPGGNIEQALAKASLADREELNGLIFLLGELEVHGCTIDSPPPLNTVPLMAMRRLIGSSSIHGKARFEAAEADIGIIDQAAHQTFITGKAASINNLQNKRGFLKKDKDKEREGQASE